jgi:hypothetical protein
MINGKKVLVNTKAKRLKHKAEVSAIGSGSNYNTKKDMKFIKNGNEQTNKCNFDCFYYCYKMNLEKDIIWLE